MAALIHWQLDRLMPMLPADFLPICRVECTFIILDRDVEVPATSHDTMTGMPLHPLEARTLLGNSVCPPVMNTLALIMMHVRQLF